jgi:hypothetical protein
LLDVIVKEKFFKIRDDEPLKKNRASQRGFQRIKGRVVTTALSTPSGWPTRSFARCPWRARPHAIPPRPGSAALAVQNLRNRSGGRRGCEGTVESLGGSGGRMV